MGSSLQNPIRFEDHEMSTLSNEGPEYRMALEFNRSLLRELVRYLDPQPGDRILDIGCSRGFYVRALAEYGSDVVGVDISDDALARAVTDRVERGDATRLRFETGTFDKVFSLHTVEHVPDSAAFVNEVARVLKPGGMAIVVYPWELFRGMQAIGAAIRHYRNPLAAGRIHVHRLTPRRLEDLVARSPLSHRESRLARAWGIQYLTILDKPTS
jgi:SAM-dependent methyltransferase